jgi:hypothetical protein
MRVSHDQDSLDTLKHCTTQRSGIRAMPLRDAVVEDSISCTQRLHDSEEAFVYMLCSH